MRRFTEFAFNTLGITDLSQQINVSVRHPKKTVLPEAKDKILTNELKLFFLITIYNEVPGEKGVGALMRCKETGGSWKEPGGSLESPEGAWREPGGSLEGAWREPGGSLEGAWREPGGSLEGAWRESGGSLEGE
jgi:hypothetical protein